MGEKMINLTIDGVQLQVPEGTSVMSAAQAWESKYRICAF